MSTSKQRKELFVSNNNGTTTWETFVMVECMPFFVMVHGALFASLLSNEYAEILTVAIPLLLTYTVGADYLGGLGIPLATLVMGVLVKALSLDNRGRTPSRKQLDARGLESVTILRGCAVLSTCIAILAVDFHVFPRRLAKTEHYGTGLMDVGVGAFIFTGALVQGIAGRRPTTSRSSLKTKNIVAILVLGFSRLFVIKLIDYQEHLSEYGMHWNFFFTLAVVRTGGELLAEGRSARVVLGMGVVLLCLYQYALSGLGLSASVVLLDEDVETRRRHWAGVLWQNKEGFASSVGYLSLSLIVRGGFGVIGRWGDFDPLKWTTLTFGLWASLFVSQTYVEPISRRSANLAFCLWICALGTGMIALASVWLSWSKSSSSSLHISRSALMSALSKRQLEVFLFANLLTGFVNFSVDTLGASTLKAVLVLSLYVVTVCVFALKYEVVRRRLFETQVAAVNRQQ